MKAKQKTKGKCCFCNGEFGKAVMVNHLLSCNKRRDSVKKSKTFLIKAECRYAPEYWLFAEVKTDAKLVELDNFLRDIWLECCGHMSSFQIDGIEYSVAPIDDMGDESMDIAVKEVLGEGMRFFHQYDFGSTTELKLKVIAEQSNSTLDKPVKLSARNNPPQMNCEVCGKPAVWICTECLWSDGNDLFCQKCADSHECDSEMYLPVVNSPRTGVCGYTGE